jgi:hypothetical protein
MGKPAKMTRGPEFLRKDGLEMTASAVECPAWGDYRAHAVAELRLMQNRIGLPGCARESVCPPDL